MGFDFGLALLHPVDGGHARGEFGEYLPEHALTAVAVDDALVVDEPRGSFRQRPLRHAGGDRLLFQIGEEAVETHAVVAGRAAAWGRGRRRCGWPGRTCRRPGWSCRRPDRSCGRLGGSLLQSVRMRQQGDAEQQCRRRAIHAVPNLMPIRRRWLLVASFGPRRHAAPYVFDGPRAFQLLHCALASV
jgi:hypothetical protein